MELIQTLLNFITGIAYMFVDFIKYILNFILSLLNMIF